MARFVKEPRNVMDIGIKLAKLNFNGSSGSEGEEEQENGKSQSIVVKTEEKQEKKTKKKKTKLTPADVLATNYEGRLYDTFESMNLNKNLLEGIYADGMEKPSDVQQRGIVPCIQGRDAIIQGQSGMGKTACFVIASIARLKIKPKDRLAPGCLALVLAPTRELAKQIHRVYQTIGNRTGIQAYYCSGQDQDQSVRQNIERLKQGVHVIVGTPGRILHLIDEKSIDPKTVQMLILDEADEMLERRRNRRGNISSKFHFEDLQAILSMFQKRKGSKTQVIFTSATFSEDIVHEARPFMKNPLKILVKNEGLTLEGIEQFYLEFENPGEKTLSLLDIIDKVSTVPTIVFCSTRETVENLVQEIFEAEGPKCLYIHGELEQADRNDILYKFRSGRSKLLISSDLFGRGLDIQQLQFVINYDMPPDTTQYIHRVGRSGRYGRKGVALNFIASEDDQSMMKTIQEFYHTSISPMPQDMLKYFK